MALRKVVVMEVWKADEWAEMMEQTDSKMAEMLDSLKGEKPVVMMAV